MGAAEGRAVTRGPRIAASATRALLEVGLRPTRQRRSVLDGLRERRDAVTAQELHRELVDGGQSIGLTTVYRTLTALADAGLVDRFTRDGEQAFRRCGDDHHHHIVCEACNRVEEITAEEVERWVSEIADRRGYVLTGHRADVFGICADCR
jgi:Fur family ferric uptake transcriptional regulator